MPHDNYNQLLEFLLPEGILDYFEITHSSKENKNLYIHLKEKNIIPQEYKDQKTISKGFYPEVQIQDFPIRGKAVFLCVQRRRWLIESTGEIISRNWDLISSGTRMTKEFAAFLKGILRYNSGKL